MIVTGSQIRAARALLGWSQSKLATEAEIGEMTVKRFENSLDRDFGTVKTVRSIKQALENGGVIFMDDDGEFGPGVRLSKSSGY